MKKLLLVLFLAIPFLSVQARSACSLDDNTFVLVTVLPPYHLPIPWHRESEQMDIEDYVVCGVKAGLTYSTCESVYGVGVEPVSWCTETMAGLHCSLYGSLKRGYGLQVGVWNYAASFAGLQVGLVNVCDDCSGVQIGLVNVIGRDSLPWFPIVNMNF